MFTSVQEMKADWEKRYPKMYGKVDGKTAISWMKPTKIDKLVKVTLSGKSAPEVVRQYHAEVKSAVMDFAEDNEWVCERKLDGQACEIRVDKDAVQIYTGSKMTTVSNLSVPHILDVFDSFRRAHKGIFPVVFLAEIIVGDGLDVNDACNVSLGATKPERAWEKQEKLGLYNVMLFDVLLGNDSDEWGTLRERKDRLNALVKIHKELRSPEFVKVNLTTYTQKNKKELYEVVLRTGAEGVVFKHLDSLYYPGTRSQEWYKMKTIIEDDVVVYGFQYGTKAGMRTGTTVSQGTFGNTVGSITIGAYDDAGELVPLGEVSQHLTDEIRNEFRDYVLKKPHVVRGTGVTPDRVIMTNPKDFRIAEIKHYGFAKKAFRHAGLLRWRDDKARSDVLAKDIIGWKP